MITLTKSELHNLMKDAYYEGYLARSPSGPSTPVTDVLGHWEESESLDRYEIVICRPGQKEDK